MFALESYRWTLPAGALLAATAACNDPETPVSPYPDGGYVQPYPTTTTTPVDAGPVAQTGPCDQMTSQGLQVGIKTLAKGEIDHGMVAESTFACQNVAQGQAASATVILQPGMCYAFVGQAFPNVTELDLQLKFDPLAGVATPMPIQPLMAQDGDQGLIAIIGRKRACYESPLKGALAFPLTVRIEAQARTGSGPVAVQVFSMKKMY